jgi:ribosomal protein S18 acetylase RimI-like enzyme
MIEEYQSIEIIERLPTSEEYNQLRKAVGWHSISINRAERGLSNSLFSVCAIVHQKVIGFGRVVGDGKIYFYIHDVIVYPTYQKSGIGHRIMQTLMEYVNKNAPAGSGAFVGLMIAPGLENFYSHYGFKSLPEDSPAMGMWKNGH